MQVLWSVSLVPWCHQTPSGGRLCLQSEDPQQWANRELHLQLHSGEPDTQKWPLYQWSVGQVIFLWVELMDCKIMRLTVRILMSVLVFAKKNVKIHTDTFCILSGKNCSNIGSLCFRFINMKLKSVTFVDSTFRNCYFDDVTSVGSLFRNCTFIDAFFFNTGETLQLIFKFLPRYG